MIVLSEASSKLQQTASARELIAATEAAKLAGCRVYYIPQDLDDFEDPADAFAHIPQQTPPALGVWIGYIPTPEHYALVYRLTFDRGIRLLNTPEEHLRAQEFDRAYERLEGLTPLSIIVRGPDECAEAVEKLGLPIFVKGAVQSRKARGWKACVADNVDDLRRLVEQYLTLTGRTRGRVVLRQIARLRHVNVTGQGFPIGREFRVFLYNGEVLGHGYYWDGDDPLMTLTAAEEAIVLSLASTAARRLETPFVAVDIGQVECGEWIVIEAGDAQFSGVSRTPMLQLWHRISMIV